MKLEFLVVADAAQVADGKLFMLGGGWMFHRAASYPAPAQFGVAVSILVPWNEAGIRYPSTLTIADEAGVPIIPTLNGHFEVGKSEQVPEGTMQRALVAVNFVAIQIPRPGRYVIAATAGTSKIETSFESVFVGKRVELTPEGEPPLRGN